MYKVKLTANYLPCGEYEFKNIETATSFVELALETYKGEDELEATITRAKKSLGEKIAEAKENQ